MQIDKLIEVLEELKAKGVKHVFINELDFFQDIKIEVEKEIELFKDCIILTKKD